jgi:hypothetical protein
MAEDIRQVMKQNHNQQIKHMAKAVKGDKNLASVASLSHHNWLEA